MHDVPASGQFPVDNGHQYMHDGQWTSPFGFQTLNTSASSNQYYRSVGDKIMKIYTFCWVFAYYVIS